MNTMNTQKPGYAERFGRWLGRAWRGYTGLERQMARWLVARGLPTGAAIALLWIVKLVMLAALLYVVFWLALLLLFAVAVTRALSHGALDSDDEQESMIPNDIGELRMTLGYDPNLYNDASHEMYRKDD